MDKVSISMFASKYWSVDELKREFARYKVLTADLQKGKTGAVRVYVDGRPTSIVARGGGYDKKSAALGDFINLLAGTTIQGEKGEAEVIKEAKQNKIDVIPVDEKVAGKPKNVIDSYVIRITGTGKGEASASMDCSVCDNFSKDGKVSVTLIDHSSGKIIDERKCIQTEDAKQYVSNFDNVEVIDEEAGLFRAFRNNTEVEIHVSPCVEG